MKFTLASPICVKKKDDKCQRKNIFLNVYWLQFSAVYVLSIENCL